jgi:hypothetical protein
MTFASAVTGRIEEETMAKQSRCKYCHRMIDNRGLPSHTHFRHLRALLISFRLDPTVCYFADIWPPRFDQLQLPATVASKT